MGTKNNIVVFDVETQRDIASVGGYDFLERLGISVAVAYHVGERRFYSFEEPELGELVALLQRADLVVGFNIRRFDLRVLSAYTEADLSTLPLCDMLEHVEQALGHRVKLDGLARNTLGLRKSADGTRALEWWREGKVALIRDYCRQDVDVTRRLWEYGRDNGFLWYWDQQQRQRARVAVRW